MRALGGAITSPCSNDSENRRPTPTIFGLSPHLLAFRWMLLDSPIQITALSGRLLIVFCVHTWLVQLPLQHWIICMLNSFVSADRRATARTTTSLSHAAIRQKKSSSSFDDPQLVNIDCTGLGGHDLGGFKDYDICIRTDKHSQSICGPSVTPLESPGRDGTHHVSLVALGGSKAMHEFLVLHYMATDSAEEWDFFLDTCLPQCTWVRAGSRRALALHMYNKGHVAAPSHRRFAHPSWIAWDEVDAWPAAWCPSTQVPAITPCRSPTCSSLCTGFLSWFLQRHLPTTSFVEHASCPSGRHFGRHCSSPSIATWDPAWPWCPTHGDPPHYR